MPPSACLILVRAGRFRERGDRLKKDDVVRLFDYTEWANHRTVRASATLGVADWRKDLGASHGGVRGTLAHMLGAEWIWLERFKGVSPTSRIDEAEFQDVLALKERWAVIERHRRDWLAGLREKDLPATVEYRALDGKPYAAPLWQLAQHVANHSTLHRGQVVALLRQLGAKPAATDLLLFDREAARREKGQPG
jgi:uncharacterized damage-inducible protein DinB